MFGFQGFTETSYSFVVNLILSFMSVCNLLAFGKEILKNETFGVIFISFHLVLFIAVNIVMSRIVVVYLDGELESVTKEKFLEAIRNQDISYILSRNDELEKLVCMNFFLSSFELELVEGEIERILWKRYSKGL